MRLLERLPFVAMAGVLVVWFVLFRPVALGGPAGYEIVAGASMEPLLHTGDLVITQSQAAYEVGDIIVFHVPSDQQGAGSSVIHRIVGGSAVEGFVVKGDNKVAPDPWRPKASDIVGRSWTAVPGAGRLLIALRSPLVLATFIGGLAGFWFLTSESPMSGPRKPRRSSPQSEAVDP